MKKLTQKQYNIDRQVIEIDNSYGEVFFPVKLKEAYSVFDNHLKVNYIVKQIHLNPIYKHTIKVNDEGLTVLEIKGTKSPFLVEFILDVSLEEFKRIAHLALTKFEENFEFDRKKDYFICKLYPCKLKDFQHRKEIEKHYKGTRYDGRIYQNFCQDTNSLQKEIMLCENNPNQAYI